MLLLMWFRLLTMLEVLMWRLCLILLVRLGEWFVDTCVQCIGTDVTNNTLLHRRVDLRSLVVRSL